ncbi:MAG: hypothetical protein Q8P73_02030 [bacterium]|nr:hypothetical protein [bacterium]
MKELKKVLVVEDNPSHLRDAVAYLQSQGLEVITATNASDGADAMRRLHEWKHTVEEILVDGVISDVFMPLSKPTEWNRKFQHSNDPCGLILMREGNRCGIPHVLCTDGYHHGAKLQWIFDFCHADNDHWFMADASESVKDGQAEHKDWAKALEILRRCAAETEDK